MAIVRRLQKPDFEQWETGGWVHPDPFSMELKRSLWDCFPSQWTWAEKADVLYSVGQGFQSAQAFFEETAAAARHAQLQRVQEKARALLQALASLTPEAGQALDAHLAYLILASDAPEKVSQHTEFTRREHQTISQWWDIVQDVEVAAAYAATQESPSKAYRPAIQNAKRLVYWAADAVYSVRGALPPRGKGTWFPEFASELGNAFGLSCGPALVDSVVKKMDREGSRPKKAPVSLSPDRRLFFVPPVPSPI